MRDIITAIQERKRQAQRLRGRIKSATAELLKTEGDLAALIKAAGILGVAIPEDSGAEVDPTEYASGASEEDRQGRGRKPGAISMEWRSVLQDMYFTGGRFDYPSIHELARQNGIQVEMSSTRERVRRFLDQGYLMGDSNIGFSATVEAAERFGFAHRDIADARSDAVGHAEPSSNDGLRSPIDVSDPGIFE